TGAVSGASIVSVSGSGSFYTVTVDTGSGDGTIRLDVLADGTIVDRVGNTNATFTTGQTYTINRTGPTVSLTSATPTTTNANPIRVTVIFSADVTGFDVSDLTLVNATAENFTAVDARTYTFDLIPTTEGMVSVDVAAGVAADSLGNLSQAAATFTRTFDSIAPTAAFSSATPTATNASPIPVTLTFSEGVSGFDIADLVPTNGTVSNFTMVDARTYTFDLTPTTDGPVSVDVIGFDGVTDAAGNPSGTPAIFSRTSDRTRPTPTIALAPGQNTITTQRTVLFTVTFSEPVSGFDATDVTTTGTAGGMVSVTGSGTNYTVTVSGLTVNGMVGIRVNEAGGIDAVGNGNIAGTSPEVRYNATPTGVVVGSSVGGNTVQLFDQTGQVTNTIIPFPGFLGSIQTTSADMNGDGVMDLAVGAGPGGGPHVRVFDGATGAELASFFAFDPAFTGGVNVASGDINGDGVADLIVGAGAGGGPHVKAFDGKTGAEIHSFFAFDPTFRGGVNVAVGDLDGDGRGEIVTGAGAGGGPHVKVFDGKTGAEIHSFFAFDPSFRGGVNVAVGDLDGDGRGEIVTGAGPGGGPHVKVFDGKDLTERASFMAYDLAFTGGVDVAVRDVNRDGFADLVTGAGPGGGPHVKAFDGRTFGLLQEFFAADATFNGGVYVG
nr:Ig-like domain-containing protein [Fimbriiglobus sp.]